MTTEGPAEWSGHQAIACCVVAPVSRALDRGRLREGRGGDKREEPSMSDQTEHQAEEVKKAAEKDREPTTAERTTEKVDEEELA